MFLLCTEHRSLQHILIVFVLKLFERQNTVIFIASNDVVSNQALFTPKHATLETIRSLGAFLVAISTSYLAGFALFNSEYIDQAVQIKTGWKIFQIATFRYSANAIVSSSVDRNCVSKADVLDR